MYLLAVKGISGFNLQQTSSYNWPVTLIVRVEIICGVSNGVVVNALHCG